MKPINRLRELDFLRGIAILLVLLRHQKLFSFTQNMGWIGVDLFFTLSGFLVSGLLFKEYQKFGKIQPKRFLIRRGFKIYPIYYLSYLLYLIPIIIKGKLTYFPLIGDLFFIQNYLTGWGYAYAASWSLAVEEHFYFGLSLFLWLAIKYKFISFEKSVTSKKNAVSFDSFIIFVLGFCLILRTMSNLLFPESYSKNFTMTHLRIDSLLAGVLVAYLFYFKKEQLLKKFSQFKTASLSLVFLLLLWTPFLDATYSFFVKTIGFSLLYISFGTLLIYFIITPNINAVLDTLFNKRVVNIVSKIGYCSYSIYIIHTFVNNYSLLFVPHNLTTNLYFKFFFTSSLSILVGMAMTYYIESYFLKVRDKLVPSRTS